MGPIERFDHNEILTNADGKHFLLMFTEEETGWRGLVVESAPPASSPNSGLCRSRWLDAPSDEALREQAVAWAETIHGWVP